MTPLSRVQMRMKLTNTSSRVITDLQSGGGYINTLARIESVCTFKLGVNCLMLSISLTRQFLQNFETPKEVLRNSTRVVVVIVGSLRSYYGDADNNVD